MDNFDQNQHSASVYQKDIVRSLSKFFEEYLVHLFEFALEYKDGTELSHFQKALNGIRHWHDDESGTAEIADLYEKITTDYPDLCSDIEMFFQIREHMMRQSMFGNGVPVQTARHIECAMLFYEMLTEMCTIFQAKTHLFDWNSIDEYVRTSENWKCIQDEIKRAIIDVMDHNIRKPSKDDMKQFQHKARGVIPTAPAAKVVPFKPVRLQQPHEFVSKSHTPSQTTPVPEAKEVPKQAPKQEQKEVIKEETKAKKSEVKDISPKPKLTAWKSSHRKEKGKPVQYEESSESEEASADESEDEGTASESESASGSEESDREDDGEGDEEEEEEATDRDSENESESDNDADSDEDEKPKKE